jgi:hypothetical protein
MSEFSRNRRLHYTAKFKRKVIAYADEHGNREAGRMYGVSECNVLKWKKIRAALFLCAATRQAFTGPKSARYPVIDEAVAEFVREQRSKSLPVTRAMLILKAKETSNAEGCENSKASLGWLTNFMKQYGFSLRRRTSICQKLPPFYEEKLISFQRYVINLRKQHEYLFNRIGNADETAVYFDMLRNTTVSTTGAKEVKMLTTGYEKHRVTVMLCVTADGCKLPPYLIFKRKTVPKREIFPKDVIICANEKGWMTESMMLDWVPMVWGRRPGACRKERSMLVLDAFKGHITEAVKARFPMMINTDPVIIPGGMTSQVQPLDVGINKSPLNNTYAMSMISGSCQITYH